MECSGEKCEYCDCAPADREECKPVSTWVLLAIVIGLAAVWWVS